MQHRQLDLKWRLIKEVIHPYRKHLFALFLVSCYLGIDPSIFSYQLKMITDGMVQAAGGGSYGLLVFAVCFYLALNIVALLAYRLDDWLLLRIEPGLENNIVDAMADHLLGHAHHFYQEHATGNLIAQINEVANGIPKLCGLIVGRLLFQFMAVVSSLFVLWLVAPQVAYIFFVWIIGFVMSAIFVVRNLHVSSEKASALRNYATGAMVDAAGNILSVRFWAARMFERERLSGIFRDWVQAVRDRDWLFLKLYIFQSIWWVLREGISVILVSYLLVKGTISIGDVVLFFSTSQQLTIILWGLTKDLSEVVKLIGEVSQGLGSIMVLHEIVDVADAQPIQIKSGAIVFDHVSFGYEGREPIFNDLSVAIPSGQKVGLVGYSGAGKTTFVNLILRLYDLSGGEILIDGQNIAKVTQESLRKAVAFVPQDPSLFHRTIMENIRYGLPHASDEAVFEAVALAHADEFIRTMHKGYDALVGDRGLKLSGGQRQRIALARAFLKRAPILIMDEATSALDSITEGYIQDSLKLLMQGRTTIVIAHRLATLLAMDRILVFDKGLIVEDGSHEVLMQQKGLYAKMWDTQSCGFLPS